MREQELLIQIATGSTGLMIAFGAGSYNSRPNFLDDFFLFSGFGVYSTNRHVSIEKYNILWLKGIMSCWRETDEMRLKRPARTLDSGVT